MERLTIKKPDDFHVHFRNDANTPMYVKHTALGFARALAMPNTVPPVCDADGILSYRARLESEAPAFTPLMAFKLMPGMDQHTVSALKAAGAVAGKLYPAGVTTNSSDGFSRMEDAYDLLSYMEDEGLVLCVHAEDPEALVTEREVAFLPQVEKLVRRFESLKIVVEHVSTKQAVRFVQEGPATLAATVTLHHLMYTVDDLLGTGLDPHLYCKPLLRGIDDRWALREAVFAGTGKFFFGSDSAPHPRVKKECSRAAAGVYSAPVLLPALAGLFEHEADISLLEDFVSRFGAGFYGLAQNEQTITLERNLWKVPHEYDGVVPMLAGRVMQWNIRPRGSAR